jgi:acetyl esterase/lipase
MKNLIQSKWELKRGGAILLASVVFLSGCESLGLTYVNTLARLQKPVVIRDIDYGAEERQKLDLYRSRDVSSASPVVVFFHGGSWMQGSKDKYIFVGEALASKGFIVVIPNYRLYPQVKFPEFVEDGALALKWVHKNIHQFDGDSNDLYVMGHSAGAHSAALLTLDEHYLESVGGSNDWLSGMIGLAGPYDWFPYFSERDKAIFGPPPRYPLSQPVNFVEGDEPPLLLMYGDRDRTVKPRNIKNLAAAVLREHGRVRTIYYAGLGHIDIIGAPSIALRSRAPVLDDLAIFIDNKTGTFRP